MKKPSIFSKDYEKIMRKRKRKKIIIGILSICIIGILVTEVANYDFSKLKDRLQAWVDEDKETDDNEQLVQTDETNESSEVQEPMVEETPVEKYLDVTISDTPISFKLKEENSETLIESVKEVPENYYIYISFFNIKKNYTSYLYLLYSFSWEKNMLIIIIMKNILFFL